MFISELFESKLLDKKTPTVGELAKKYGVSTIEVHQQLKKGINTELEHTSDRSIAREIALDHIGEHLHYYEKLNRIEKDMKECGGDEDCDCGCQDEEISEKWSAKYKRSINCSHPKGFSQRAHCAGRKKK